MLVSLKITPLDIRGLREDESASLLLRFSVQGMQANVLLTRDLLLKSIACATPLVAYLTEPEAPMPSAKEIKRATMKQEQRVAEDLGGRRQVGSGALAWNKGDGRVKGKYRIENKMRFTKGITITRDDLAQIRAECGPGEVPLFQVDFAKKGTCGVEDSWILIPYEHWKKVLRAATPDD